MSVTAPENDVLGIEEVMSMLRVSRSMVYVLVREKRIPQGARIGRKRLWLKADLVAFLHRKGGNK